MTDPFAPQPTSPEPTSPEPIIPEPISADPGLHCLPTEEPLDGLTSAAGAETPAPSDLPSSLTPLYAAAGLAEVVAATLRARLNRGQTQAKTLPEMTRSRLAEAQRQLKEYRDQLNQGYVSLASRGKPTVDSTIGTVKHLSGRTQPKVTDVSDTTTLPPVDQPIVGSDAAAEAPVVVQPLIVVESVESVYGDPTNEQRGE